MSRFDYIDFQAFPSMSPSKAPLPIGISRPSSIAWLCGPNHPKRHHDGTAIFAALTSVSNSETIFVSPSFGTSSMESALVFRGA